MKIIKVVLFFLFSTIASAQHLIISTSGGDDGPISGTNWGISDNVLYVGGSGSASINTSVITNHLATTGNLTINLPGQADVARNIYINNTIAYLGSSARTLTFQSGNDIVFANTVGITSATASLNVVLRSATTTSTPNNGLVKMDGININTKGGHLWVGGGPSAILWNGFYVGNSAARTYLDDVAGISVVGSTIASGGGKIYMYAQSWNTTDDDGVNYGINVENSNVSSGSGSINFAGGVYGRYNNGIGMRVIGTSATSITSTTGAITIYGYGTDATTNGNLWRTATMINGSVSIKSVSGNIAVTGEAAFASPVNDKEGLVISDGSAICSQTGNITLNGTNTLESSGQYSNSIRFAAGNLANSIRIGYDGTNAYSGNITIEGNSIYQRSTHAGAGSIAVQTTGTLTIQPTGTAFTYIRAGDGGSLTFDDDWNFGTNLGGFVYGKSTNTTALTYSNALTTNGPITMYAGPLTQNGAVSSGGAITFNCSDFALGDGKNLSTSTASDITINANGYFDTSGSTRRTISSANGNIVIHADKDANGSGMISIDYLTLNPGTGATIIRGETVSFLTGSVNGPYINGTGSFTFQSSDASFGQTINTSWFEIDQDNNGIGGLTIGKAGSIADIIQDRAISTAGPVNMYGNNITISSALTATNSNINLYAAVAVTQSAALTANGLDLYGTGTYTLTNTSNNIATLSGGSSSSKLGSLSLVDASGGLTIGALTNTGITASGTIAVATLNGDITLANNIKTDNISSSAVTINAGQSRSFGDAIGGNIIVSGLTDISTGTNGIIKLFSGREAESTGLTTFVSGATNVRLGVDETTATFAPVLANNNKYALYRFNDATIGGITIVSSGGVTVNNGWEFVNNTIIPTTAAAISINASVLQNYLLTNPLTVRAGSITFNTNLVNSTANQLTLNSYTFINNTAATTITTAGGNVVMASNTDDASDNDNTTNGYIQFSSGLTMTTNGGNITLGGGDASASGYALGTSAYPYEGLRVDGTININSGGGNIIMRGKSYAISTASGSWGMGFWNLSTGSITSGTGTITLDGFSQSSGGTHNSGLYTYGALTVTSANTTADAIKLIGKSTGASGQAWGIEAESALSVLATGNGGGISVSTSQQIADNYDAVFRDETNILAKSGPIQLLGKQDSGVANGRWLTGSNFYLGSNASSTAVPTSSSNILIQYDKFEFSGLRNIATIGTVTFQPASTSFGQTVETSSFSWNQNSQTMTGLTIGKPGNTSTITHQTNAITVAGPVSVYGGALAFNSVLTATNNNINLYASGAVTQTAALSANGLDLNGTGTYTLTNTSNAIATLSGGSSTSKLGSLSFVDASGGLTVGTLNNTGITASGAISVATFNGDITLSNNIQTDNTTSSAVIINAGQSRSLGDAQGGNIIISGSPVITTGANGITKLFSGREAESTGLTSYVGGSANVRNSVDESTVTFSPVLSAGNKHALYRYDATLFGNITIVTSGGASINNGWEFVNNTIQPTSATTVNINASVVNAYLIANPLTIRAGSITFNADVTGTNANNLSILSNTYIDNSSATTITTQGGNVLFASNVDNDTDGESTTNGYIQLRSGITINSNGGNITFGGGNTSGSDYSLGSSDISYTEGVRFDGTIALNSGGGNIALRGKSYAMGVYTSYGASGVGFYYFSGATGTINSGTGTITIDGFSQTNTSSYASGIYSMHNMTITSANTTTDAIRLIGKATGTSGEAWGIETESIFSVLATGTGGGITVSSSQQNSGNNYDIVWRGETNILAKSGPINLLGGQSGGIANGTMLIGNNMYLGSKALSAVPTSSSTITIQYDLYNFSNLTPKLATSGTLNWKPVSASFGASAYTSWFDWNQNSQTLSGLTIGKSGNARNVYLNNAITVAGPISVYGNYVEFTGNITSSANGDIFIKSLINGYNPSVYIGAVTINKSAGTGTLTFQASGRVLNYGTLSATGTGRLNVVMWSDYDNTNDDGGISHMGTISTNNGHVWMGGSNATSGSYTWNGLTVGDGPSIGSTDYNCNAMDLFGPITTGGGDVLIWANSPGCGTSGIVSDTNRLINAGSGNITLIAPQTLNAIELTSTGVISLVPHAGSYASALTLGGTLTSGNFTFNTSFYNGLKINSLANSGLVVGNYSGHLSGVTAVTQGNTSTVTASSALSTKSLAIYGGSVVASAALTAAGNMILDGDTGSFLTQNTKGVEINAAVTTTNNGNITIHGRGGNATAINTHGINVTNQVEAGGTGNLELIGYGGLSVSGPGSSCHGVNIEGASAWVKSNGGNVIITGNGGGAGAGTYSQGVPILTTAKVSAGGTGTINITGTGGVNTAIGLRGIVIETNSSVFSAGGAITITGTNGTNGSDNSDGVSLNTAFIGSSSSGPITISGTAGGGTGSDAISMSSTNTVGGGSHASNITLRGNNMALAGTNSVTTSGQVTIEPYSNSFTSALVFPIPNLTLANTITGLTLGKLTNSANITFNSNTNIAGPISAYGGIITLDANLTTTNIGAISLYSDNPLGGLTTTRLLTAAGAFKYIPRVTTFTADVTYPIANLTATSTGLTIGKTTNDKNITVNQDVTGPFDIELYGNNVNINSNLTTSAISANMYLKGNTTIAAGKSITSGGNFTHNGNLIFKSNATGTAAFGTLGGTFTTLSGGTSTVERYIPAKRAYRLLSSSVTTTTSIRDNWQENGGTTAGLGTHITGAGGATNGFDITTTNNPSLYTINNSTGNWAAVTNTSSNILSAGTAYRLMVRGDRTISLATNTPTATVTTLRATGVLKTGNYDPTLNQASEGYSFVGNPYQAPVDIKAVLTASTNMNTGVVYYWDPTLNDRGAYVTRTLGTVNENSPPSNFNQYLQPGQAVFVKKAVTTSAASLLFTESNKSLANSAAGVFRDATTNEIGILRANLKASVNNQWTTIEGALAVFSPTYSWEVTQDDANKFSNLDEEVSFMQNNTSLAIACQSNPSATNELPMKLNNTRYANYQWQFELGNYTGATPYLFDTQNNTYTTIDNNTIVPFTVYGQELTRFKIVFQNGTLSNPDFSNQIVLYPNPGASGATSFNLEGITGAQVTLFTLLGQNIPVKTITNGKRTEVISKTSLSKGVYLVRITKDGKIAHVKWIVE